ncbi:Monoacylglycerol lipase ABHD2 [Hondaea fermentalgiana]|uniref:Monoacylglycerol lipase ABHD2 n=1 Tax=Hondaea fermentalgiana TaxID=2315210 RepID=A0A2R5G8D1_9STRA|nr:Monoacylglycerol lipase ABHD2 [Hondaea fermentalgiana]|eukprot:GBG26579.1 Monoacylglycerol lipase ABHD2 [Hondaea fermentalgiana]
MLSLEKIGDVLLNEQSKVAWLLVLMVLSRWYRSLHEHVRVAHGDKAHPVIKRWKSSSRVLREGYRPPAWWSIGTQYLVGSLHTVYHNVVRELRPVAEVSYDRELFKLKCGATVGLDWAKRSGELEAPCKHDSSKPIIFIHHGLAGCSKSQYVKSMVYQLVRQNKYRVVVMVARGCGGVPLTTPYGFTAAGFDDLAQVATHLRKENPDAKMFAVGYSLGAGLLANYLGRAGKASVFSGACVVSPCWDFEKTTPYFDVWSRHFLAASLQGYTEENREAVSKHEKVDLDKAMAATCVREFDAHAVVPVHGFGSVDDYYAKSSPITYAHQITTPTLSFNADDDPVCSVEGAHIMQQKKIFGPGLVIARTARGGHVSWGEGILGHASFMDRVILEWLDACFEHEFGEDHALQSAQEVAQDVADRVSKAANVKLAA